MPDVYDPEKEQLGVIGEHADLGIHPERREAETEELKRLFNSPSASSQGTNENKIENQIGPGHQKEDEGRRTIRNRVANRKTAIGAGITAILIGGSVSFFSIVQGPLQFIHIAKLLDKFHFSSITDMGDSRMLKSYKYASCFKNGGCEHMRLGVVGNRVAERIDARYAEIGIKKEYSNGLTGELKGITIDPEKFAENAKNGEQFRGLENNPEAFAEEFGKLNDNLHVTVTEDGKLFAAAEDGIFTGYFRNHSVNSLLAEESGFGKVSGSFATRIMGKRDGITWHPIRNLDNKITGTIDEMFTSWLQEQRERIKNGAVDEPVSATGQEAVDEHNNPDAKKTADNQQGASNTTEVADASKEATQESELKLSKGSSAADTEATGVISRLTDSTGGDLALKGAAVIGLACAANGIAKQAKAVKRSMVALPLIRMGVQAMALGNQVESGQDLNSAQLNFFAKQLNDPMSGSWAAARSIQAENGEEATGPDIPDEASISKIGQGNMFVTLFTEFKGLDTVCSVTSAGLGGLAMTVVGVLTGPVQTIAGTMIASTGVAKAALSRLVRWIAGSPIATMVFGPTFGSYINYGARLGANDTKLALGGRKLSGPESAMLKENRLIADNKQFASLSLKDRIFNPYSPQSLAGRVVDNYSPNMNVNVASMLGATLNPFKTLGSLFAPFKSKLKAATPSTYDYGFPEIGFSLDELNSANYDNPYDNARSALNTLNIPCKDSKGNDIHPCGQDYISLAQQCYGVTLSADPMAVVDSGLTSSPDTLSDEYDGINVAGIHCGDTSPAWTQIRFYILDMKTTEAADCLGSGDTTSCQQVGL